jgi:hypothetical protein
MFVRLSLVSFASHLLSCASCVPCSTPHTHLRLAVVPLPSHCPSLYPQHTHLPNWQPFLPASTQCLLQDSFCCLSHSHYYCCRRGKLVARSCKSGNIEDLAIKCMFQRKKHKKLFWSVTVLWSIGKKLSQ